jgi:hypothetical protein
MTMLRALPLILILLTGCPKPPPPGPGPGATPPTADGTSAQANGAAGSDANDPDSAPAEPLAEWALIPESVNEVIYPTLQLAASWPDPASLTPLDKAEEKSRPKPAKTLQLKQLVESLLAKDLQPKDPDAALGIDSKGRLFMRLGRTKTLGSASMDVGPEGNEYPLFSIVLDSKGEGPRSLATLVKRVKKSLAKKLGEELETKGHSLEAHPKIDGGERVAALADLDRNGFGMQFPYLYAYGSAKHVLIILQEVPHMAAPGD